MVPAQHVWVDNQDQRATGFYGLLIAQNLKQSFKAVSTDRLSSLETAPKIVSICTRDLLPESWQMSNPEVYQARPHPTPSFWNPLCHTSENTKGQETWREGRNDDRPLLYQILPTTIRQKYFTQSLITKTFWRFPSIISSSLRNTGFESPPSHQPGEPITSRVL